MTNHHLEALTVGDVLWLPPYGDESPVWLVTRLMTAGVNGYIRDCVELLDLEDCHVQVVARVALNQRTRIL